MRDAYLFVLVLGVFTLTLAPVSALLRRSPISANALALLVGIALGPSGTGLIHFPVVGAHLDLLEQAARITLAISLMDAGLRLPPRYFRDHWRSMAVLLGLAMPLMWLISGVSITLVLGVPLLHGLLAGGVITPTDPVIAGAIVSGPIAERNLPRRLRDTITAESGANDGTAFPLVALPILLMNDAPGLAVKDWLIRSVLGAIGVAIVVGALLGLASGWMLRRSRAKATIGNSWELIYAPMLALMTLAAVKLLGDDAILAVFVAGTAFRAVMDGVSTDERMQSGVLLQGGTQMLTLAMFLLLGLAVPLHRWLALGWAAPLLVVVILLLRRVPVIWLLDRLIQGNRSRAESLFLGWFGPIGVSALFYANLAVRRTGFDTPWVVGSLMVCASIFVHGVTAVPFARALGKTNRQETETGSHTEAPARQETGG